MFIYNSEYFIIVEENLNYFQTNETVCQFKLVEMRKIVDIANLVRPTFSTLIYLCTGSFNQI